MPKRERTSHSTKGNTAPKKKAGKSKAAPRVGTMRTGGLMGLDKNFYDVSLVDHSIPAPTDCAGGEADPATVLCLSAPGQGSTSSTRDGKRIHIKNLQVKGRVYHDAAEYTSRNASSDHSSHRYLLSLTLPAWYTQD